MFTREGDVTMFFLFFENVVMRGKNKSEKVFELLEFPEGASFHFYFQTFTINISISEAGKDLSIVKNAFLEKFPKKEEPQDVIREVTNASFDERDMLETHYRPDALYTRAVFNDKGRLWFFRVAVTKMKPLPPLRYV